MEARKLSKSDPQPFQLSLRIRHPSMDPTDISRAFKIEAEHSYRAGDPRTLRSGIAPASVHAESYWLGALDPVKWPPDISFPGHPKLQIAAEHLRATATNSFSWALSLSTTGFFHKHATLLRRISSEGGQISLLVTLSAGEVDSFSLMPEVSRTFGEFGITVEFELTHD
jgi:hypothetical protein